jgi:translocator protein
MSNKIKLSISLAIPLLVGFIGSFFTSASVTTWYPLLIKPELNPPSWLFAPVWTILYIFMGYACYLVWRGGLDKNKLVALALYDVQLLLNLGWSLAFFKLQNPQLGLIVILAMWFAILITMTKFFKISQLAGWLFVPYLLWVTFATYLNYMIWYLN